MTRVRVTFATVNLGRGVTVLRFTRRAAAVLRAIPGRRRVIGFQEIDEADTPLEHKILARLLRMIFTVLGVAVERVGWGTREPIVIIGPDLPVIRERVTPASDGLRKWTPDRSITEAVINVEGAELAVLDWHPPRNVPQTQSRIKDGRKVLAERVEHHVAAGRSVIILGDENNRRPPKTMPSERTAASEDLDHVRYVEAPGGVRIKVVRTGSVHIGIDGHSGEYAVLDLTAPAH